MDLITFLGYVLFIEIDVFFALVVGSIIYTWTMANKDTKDYDHYDE